MARILSRLGARDYRRSNRLVNGCIDCLYTPLGATLYRSLTHTDYFPLSTTVSSSRFLATASTEGDSSACRTQVLLSQRPVQNSCQLTTQLGPRLATISHQPASFPYTVFQLNCQLNSPTHLPAASRHFTQLNC
jgi:hypothetical protein